MAVAVALPFLLLSAGIVWRLAENERANRREAILYSTRTLVNATDALLSKHIAIGQILATSIPLQVGDYVAFRQSAEHVVEHLAGGWIVLSDQNGQQLVNLLRPLGEPLPRHSPQLMEELRRTIQTRRIQISDVFVSALPNNPVIAVNIPVIREGKPPLVLAIILDTKAFKMLLDERHLPDGWLAGILDRNGNFVARSRDHERFVGRPGSEGFRGAARSAREGWYHFPSLEGKAIANAHVASELSGWVIGLAAAQDVFEAPIRRTILIAVLAGGAATLLSVLLAIWAARRIASPIEQIEQGTHALLRREPLTLAKTGVLEVDRALDAFVATAGTLEQHEKDRDDREAHVRLIMRELSHRSKNLLAIVLAIARQTSRNTKNFEEFEESFNARIQALADAHDLLVEQQWVGASLEDLVTAQLSAFGMEKVTVRGDKVVLRAEAVQNVALALHELATNASKYGSLSVPEGRVIIEWTAYGDTPESRGVRLTWRETGGPPVTEPERRGFGRFVLERVTVNALGSGGTAFWPSGLVWTCDINAEHLVVPAGKAAPKNGTGAARRLAS